jgi:hypothetical protein
VRAQVLALTSFAFGTPGCVWGPCSVWGTQGLLITCVECTVPLYLSTSATEVHYTSFRILIISSAAICTNDGVVQHCCLRRLNSTMPYPVTPI